MHAVVADKALLLPPTGPSNCYVLPLVLKGGKRQRGGKVGYSGECLVLTVPITLHHSLL
jgi:hypothetical protein